MSACATCGKAAFLSIQLFEYRDEEDVDGVGVEFCDRACCYDWASRDGDTDKTSIKE